MAPWLKKKLKKHLKVSKKGESMIGEAAMLSKEVVSGRTASERTPDEGVDADVVAAAEVQIGTARPQKNVLAGLAKPTAMLAGGVDAAKAKSEALGEATVIENAVKAVSGAPAQICSKAPIDALVVPAVKAAPTTIELPAENKTGGVVVQEAKGVLEVVEMPTENGFPTTIELPAKVRTVEVEVPEAKAVSEVVEMPAEYKLADTAVQLTKAEPAVIGMPAEDKIAETETEEAKDVDMSEIVITTVLMDETESSVTETMSSAVKEKAKVKKVFKDVSNVPIMPIKVADDKEIFLSGSKGMLANTKGADMEVFDKEASSGASAVVKEDSTAFDDKFKGTSDLVKSMAPTVIMKDAMSKVEEPVIPDATMEVSEMTAVDNKSEANDTKISEGNEPKGGGTLTSENKTACEQEAKEVSESPVTYERIDEVDWEKLKSVLDNYDELRTVVDDLQKKFENLRLKIKNDEL